MAVVASKGIFIVGAKRTPFCKYGGSLRELPASYAFAAAAKDALRSASIDAKWVDGTVVGNVNFLSQCDGGKTPRYCGIYSGVPLERPALGVNKACGSGLQAIISGALDILTTPTNITLTGGTDNMSSQPLFVRNTRFGTTLGTSYNLEDYITQTVDSQSGLSLQAVAESVAKKYGVGRQEADEFVISSRLKWKAAKESGILNREITPVTVEIRNKEVTVDQDEIPSPELTKSELSRMPVQVENGSVVTSGNSSSPSDGAAVIVLASEEAISRHRLTPLARLVGWAGVGGETGFGASSAVRELMSKTGRKIQAVDLVEFSETFAAVTLGLANDLDVDRGKLNTGGGALTMGHPVSATGARMITHLVYELGRLNLKTGLAASNCGGGQGLALMLEKI